MNVCALLMALVLAGQPAPDELAALVAAGRWEAVREACDLRLSLDEGDQEAHQGLGLAELESALSLLGGGRFSQDLAARQLDRAVDALALALGGPPDAQAQWLRARFVRWELETGSFEGGEPTDAGLSGDLEQAYLQDGLLMAAHLRGLQLRAGGDGLALAWFEKAAEGNSVPAAHLLDFSMALAGFGRSSDAVGAWQRALVATDLLPDDALTVLESILPGRQGASVRQHQLEGLRGTLLPVDDARLAWHLAHAFFQQDRRDEALSAFEAGTSRRTAEVDRAHASHLMVARRPLEALQLLLPRAEERDWESYDMALSAAVALALDRRHEQARAACDALLAIEPRHEGVLWNRALVLWHSGADQAATEAFAALIERLPGRADVLNDAALAAWGAGDQERSRSLLEQAVALPGAIDAMENLALLRLNQGSNEPDGAAGLLDEVLRLEPGRARALYLRSMARDGR